jgi:hypothetical protein
MMRSRVKIELRGDTYFVLYVTRAKFCRHSAGQFDSRLIDLAGVRAWISKQANLELVNP